MKKAIQIILCVVLQNLLAQNLETDSVDRYTMGVKVNVGLGFRVIGNLSEMNNALQTFTYPEIKKTARTMDLSYTFFKRQTFVTLSYRFLAFPKSKGQELSLTGFGLGSEFGIGHDFAKGATWSVYPFIGLFNQVTFYSFTYNEETSLLDAIGSIPAEPRRIKGNELMAFIGGGFERAIGQTSDKKFGFTLGFRTGYYFNLSNDWYVGIRKATTNTSTGGFEVRLTFSSIRFPKLK